MSPRRNHERCDDSALETAVNAAGRGLGPSERRAELRASLLSEVRARRAEVPRAPVTVTRRLVPALASFALATLVALGIVTSLGFASLHAMPGDPLYSFKRTLQGLRLSVESAAGRADGLLGQADARMRELDYARSHRMDSWLVPLAGDARETIEEARRQAASLGEEDEAEVSSKAAELVVEHEDDLRESVQLAPAGEREELERWVDDEVNESEDPGREEESPEGSGVRYTSEAGARPDEGEEGRESSREAGTAVSVSRPPAEDCVDPRGADEQARAENSHEDRRDAEPAPVEECRGVREVRRGSESSETLDRDGAGCPGAERSGEDRESDVTREPEGSGEDQCCAD